MKPVRQLGILPVHVPPTKQEVYVGANGMQQRGGLDKVPVSLQRMEARRQAEPQDRASKQIRAGQRSIGFLRGGARGAQARRAGRDL